MAIAVYFCTYFSDYLFVKEEGFFKDIGLYQCQDFQSFVKLYYELTENEQPSFDKYKSFKKYYVAIKKIEDSLDSNTFWANSKLRKILNRKKLFCIPWLICSDEILNFLPNQYSVDP